VEANLIRIHVYISNAVYSHIHANNDYHPTSFGRQYVTVLRYINTSWLVVKEDSEAPINIS